MADALQIVQSHLLKRERPTYGKVDLVEYGIARLCGTRGPQGANSGTNCISLSSEVAPGSQDYGYTRDRSKNTIPTWLSGGTWRCV